MDLSLEIAELDNIYELQICLLITFRDNFLSITVGWGLKTIYSQTWDNDHLPLTTTILRSYVKCL